MQPRIARTAALLALIALTLARPTAAADLPPADADGWVKLFNGRDLDGWAGDPAVWRVDDGCIVGRADRIAKNTFLIHRQPLGDFTLRARVRLTEKGRFPNSGIQYRSKILDAATHVVAGYQCDIGDGHWGDVHEEQGRSMLAKGSDDAARSVRRGDWNDYEITAIGPTLTHRVNGVVAARFEEKDAKRGATSGVLALQYHQPGDGFEIRFQDVRVKPLDAQGHAATAPTTTTAATQAAPKLAVPAADAQAAARKEIRAIFAKEYATQTPAARAALSAKLLALAVESKETPANRFTLLAESRDLAAAAGDARAALHAADRLAAEFAVDTLPMKADALTAAARAADDAKAAARAAKLALPLADDAVRAGQFDVAERIATVAESAARRGGDPVTETKARQRLKESRELIARHNRAAAAERVLAQTPDDPAANATVGLYRCLTRNDWTAGLPLLAKAADPALAALAAEELTRPATPPQRLALADHWWDAAAKIPEPDRAAYRRRAAFWYERATPGLSGLSRTLAEKRLAEVAPPRSAPPGPVDLLQLVDTDVDAVSGDWQRAGANLTVAKGQAQKIVLPASADGGYELTVRFVRHAGDDAVLIYLPAGPGGTWLVLSGWGSKLGALYDVNGKRAAEVPAGGFANNREHRVDARVELTGDDAEVTVRLNGEPYLHWRGRQSAMHLDDRWGLPNARCFALGAVEKTSFTGATARALTGGITPLRP